MEALGFALCFALQAATAAAAAPAPAPSALGSAPAAAAEMAILPYSGGDASTLQVASLVDWLAVQDGCLLPPAENPILRPQPAEAVSEVVQRSQSSAALGAPIPLGKGIVESFVSSLPKGTRRTPGGIRGAQAKFETRLVQPGKPWGPLARFPKVVNYDAECGSLCRTGNTARRLAYHDMILSSLDILVAQVEPKANTVSKCQALFIMICEVDGEVGSVFMMLSLAQGAHSRFKSQQSFARCVPVANAAPFDHRLAGTRGLEVELCRASVVDRVSELRHPFRDQTDGAIEWITEGSLAVELAQMVVGADNKMPSISMHRLRYDDMLGDRFVIQEVHPDFECVVVDPDAVPEALEHGAPAGALALEDGPPDGMEVDAEEAFDMMDCFLDDSGNDDDDGPAPSHKKPKAKAEASPEGGEEPGPEVGPDGTGIMAIEDDVALALGFDPGAMGELGSEMMEIYGMLKEADKESAAAAEEEANELDKAANKANKAKAKAKAKAEPMPEAAQPAGLAPAVAPPAAPADAPPVVPPPPAPFALDIDPAEFCKHLKLSEEKGWSYCRSTGHKVGG